MKRFLILTFLLYINGCVTTKVSSLIDPSYRNTTFHRVLVIGNFGTIDALKKFETLAVERLKEKGIYSLENHLIFPPLREYSDDEKRQVIIKEGFDAYLIISPKGFNNSTIYVPTISTTQVDINSSRSRVKGTSSTTTQEGGSREIISSVDTQGELFEFQNGNIVWQGEGNTNIPYYGARPIGSVDDVLKSAAQEIINQLIIDRVVSK